MKEKYYSVEQIAEMIDMHPKTIQRYIREGRLNARKMGKAWRVTGHDLSIFLEGPGNGDKGSAFPGMQALIGNIVSDVKISAVVDIPARNSAEAVQIANWTGAIMNSRPYEQGPASMTSQYIESEHIMRLMLWGSLLFTETFLRSLSDMPE